MTPTNRPDGWTAWTFAQLKGCEFELRQMKALLETHFAPHVDLARLDTPNGIIAEARAMLVEMSQWMPG